ncbi:hypothetical protein OPT61_g3643 [Boeremia exigua]|uniref:Uncharacterized protein n=1 Tax=Boeremia exigua TaxID=749465 RepID=A0ACC2IH25_9PLEO|nr:hypothetical protein OPT61_g3643 [Boeremia exigua]
MATTESEESTSNNGDQQPLPPGKSLGHHEEAIDVVNSVVARNVPEQTACNTDFVSLQREIELLRLKVAKLEEFQAPQADEDTDDELPDFEPGIDEDLDNPNKEVWMKVWQRWLTRRRVAREIIQKVDRLQDLKHQGKLREVIERTTRVPPPPPPPPLSDLLYDMVDVIPALNHAEWNDFKHGSIANVPSAKRHVIDVLVGKPTVVWFTSTRSTSTSRHLGAGQGAVVNPIETMKPDLSNGLLPDRIRVNSRVLLLIFSKFHNQSNMFVGKKSVVFMRPFKMFLHFQQEIRDWFHMLNEKHSKKAASDTQDSEITMVRGSLVDLSDNSGRSLTPTAEALDTSKPHDGVTVSPDDELETSHYPVSLDETLIRSEEALEHMRPLMEFMDKYIIPRQTYLKSAQCSKVTFHDMWILFRPGGEVIQSEGQQAYRIVYIETSAHRAIAPWEATLLLEVPARDSQDPLRNLDASPPLPPPPKEWSEAGDNKPFKLWCVHIDTDGFTLGPVTTAFEISAFDGEKLVTDLPIYPVRLNTRWPVEQKGGVTVYDKVTPSIRDRLIERGRNFVERNSIQHAYYAGPIYRGRGKMEGQVVIDNAQVFTEDTDMERPLFGNGLPSFGPPAPYDFQSFGCSASCCYNDVVWADKHFDQRRNVNYSDLHPPVDAWGNSSTSVSQRPIAEVQKDHRLDRIKDTDYLIMSDRVFGFVLRTRRWAELDLIWISDVKYNRDKSDPPTDASERQVTNTAFDDLVLPDGHKDVILSLVAQHFRDDSQEVDIFQGKGKGLILLLHGAPGVGKTSTAEGVAEAFKKPLLQITCGDLGFTAEKVEESLARNFDLASRWGCVLLLDEADVFLASRKSAENNADLSRNALVAGETTLLLKQTTTNALAVFLRVLEYYTGILFLTTNRIGDFDEAFASRIHLSLEYPQLSKASTESILALNMRLIKKRFRQSRKTIDIEETEICSKFSKFWEENEEARLNGRQIRNACQTALALAEFEAQGSSHKDVLRPDATVRLQPMHFNTILKAYLDFAEYLNKTYGVSPEQRAKEQKLRAKERQTRKPKLTHAQSGSASSNVGGFGGAHLYNQPVQQFAPNQQAYQTPLPTHAYQVPLQTQQFYQGPMQSQQGLQIPGQYVAPNHSYAAPGMRAIDQHLSAANVEQVVSHEDTRAGHNTQYQGQSASTGPVLQYSQPQQPHARYQ